MSLSLKACTLLSTPDRVRNVPKMVRLKVATSNERFHTRSIARRSWTSTEWMNAVPVSHGMKLAFSTGSHPHTPPHPSTSYAHHPPRMMPTVRKPHDMSVQRRVSSSQPSPTRPVMSAAIANANGTLIPT